MTKQAISELVQSLKPENSSEPSTKLIIGEEVFFLRPDFLDLVTVADVYRALECLVSDRERKAATASVLKGSFSEAHNPFSTIEEYSAWMENILTERAYAANFQYRKVEAQEKLLKELTAYFGGFHDQLEYLNPEKKTILILGGLGLGKTFLLRSFAKNPYQSYAFTRAKDLEEMVKNGGFEQFKKEAYSWQYASSPKDYFGQKRLALFVDDIGTEEVESKSYGNTNNVVKMIIEHRYEKMRYTKGLNLILSTNESFETLERYYGARAYDRLMETASVFVMPKAQSLRKQS